MTGLLPLALGAALLLPTGPSAPAATTIKMATLVPDGSVWDKAFRRMGSEWKEATDGRVQLRIYAGGVAGDEPDIIRKMRIGQLNAAALTLPGLSDIDPAFDVFEIPLYYASHEELLSILDEMTPLLRERLEERGFVLLSWGHAGWVRLFSKRSVGSPADLEKQKLFVWGDEGRKVRVWRENGFDPVPLSATDIPSGLQTGLIEAVPAPPLSALALQWFRSTPFMLDLEIVPLIGATVVTKKTWDSISEADRTAMLAAAKHAEEFLLTEVPVQERDAIAEMRERGLTVVEPVDRQGSWQPLAEKFSAKLRAELPDGIFERVSELQRKYRSR